MTPAEHADFSTLVAENNRQTEVKCGDFVHHALGALVFGTPIASSAIREDRNYFGSSDFVVTATLKDGFNEVHNCAYIWEIKAPQCYLMEPDDNKNRFRPTKDLIKAENQLIHYGYLAQQDDSFRQRYGIMDRKKILLGGIIIGRSSDRFAKGLSTPSDLQNARISLQIRDMYFYSHHHIRIYTWDAIVDFCKP